MILPFSTQLNGKPTEFVGKIWSGFIENKLVPFYNDIINNFNLEIIDVIGRKPKLHTSLNISMIAFLENLFTGQT